MDITLSTLYVTTISFIIFFIYYLYSTPEYVCVINNDNKRERSYRLCTVYALLFSSALGLGFLFMFTLYELHMARGNEIKEVIEQPTFKTG